MKLINAARNGTDVIGTDEFDSDDEIYVFIEDDEGEPGRRHTGTYLTRKGAQQLVRQLVKRLAG